MLDMSVAIGKLSTDMEWVKQTLIDIKKKLDDNENQFAKMIKEYQAQVDERFENHEKRIQNLESFRDRVKGVAITLTIFASSGLIVYVLSKLLGGG